MKYTRFRNQSLSPTFHRERLDDLNRRLWVTASSQMVGSVASAHQLHDKLRMKVDFAHRSEWITSSLLAGRTRVDLVFWLGWIEMYRCLLHWCSWSIEVINSEWTVGSLWLFKFFLPLNAFPILFAFPVHRGIVSIADELNLNSDFLIVVRNDIDC
jgi:hypothetical protein